MFIKESLEPWAPSPDAALVRVVHSYDAPLAGILEQAGHTFAFCCLDGHVERWSVWIYAEVQAAEVETLGSLPFEGFTAALMPRPGWVVLAEDEHGIRAEAHVDALHQAPSVVEELARKMSEPDAASVRRSLRLAG